jgi:hypothetical protein
MLALAWLALSFWSPPVHAEVLTVPVYEKVWTTDEVRELAIQKAEEYHLNTNRFLATLNCENGFNARGQSQHINSKGEQEDSWGAAQFWLIQPMITKDGIPITKEIAEDPEQALDAMAWHFSEGRAYKWTCYNKLYGK